MKDKFTLRCVLYFDVKREDVFLEWWSKGFKNLLFYKIYENIGKNYKNKFFKNFGN